MFFDGRETGRKETLLENIRRNIADKDFIYEGMKINLTVTIGAAHYQSGQSVSEWINAADDRLYYGKRTGKNRIIDRDM